MIPNRPTMTEPRLNHVQCLDARGLHRMAYWEWGDAANPRVLVCVHGLSRQGRDFDTLARALCGDYRVVCPDVVGRGQSDWLADPAGYQIPAYVADMVTLLARLDARELHWVGTSMGGLIGLGLASLPGSPIGRLVLNDVGPTIQSEAIARIGTYLGAAAALGQRRRGGRLPARHLEGLRPAHARAVAGADAADAQGRTAMASCRTTTRRSRCRFAAVTPELAAAGEAALWASYDRVTCPTLLLRGAESDLLSPATAQAMTQRGPKARLREFAGVGHAPTLVAPDQVAAVREFLLAP